MKNRVELLFKNKPSVYVEYFESLSEAHKYFYEHLMNNPLVTQATLYYNYDGEERVCCLTPEDFEDEEQAQEEEYEYTYEDYLEDTCFEEYYYEKVKA